MTSITPELIRYMAKAATEVEAKADELMSAVLGAARTRQLMDAIQKLERIASMRATCARCSARSPYSDQIAAIAWISTLSSG